MKTIITHDGNFHIDDVFAVAAIGLMLGESPYTIIRTRDAHTINAGDHVVDVGGVNDSECERFDHHQEGGAGEHMDGIPYSSFGLVWKKYGTRLCGSREVADDIEKRIVESIDAMDNGIDIWKPVFNHAYPYLFRDVVFAFRPTWKEKDRSVDQAFLEVVDIARLVLHREIRMASDAIEGRRKVEEAYAATSDKRIIVLLDRYPWEEVLGNYPEPLYVVSPRRGNSGWSVNAVRDDFRSFTNRKDLPASWAAKSDEELVAITGVPDAIFCHAKQWMVSARSKEGAIALARLALDRSS